MLNVTTLIAARQLIDRVINFNMQTNLFKNLIMNCKSLDTSVSSAKEKYSFSYFTKGFLFLFFSPVQEVNGTEKMRS